MIPCGLERYGSKSPRLWNWTPSNFAGRKALLQLRELIGCAAERFLTAPVIEGGTVRGFLAVCRRASPAGEDESALLSALAGQVAIALRNGMHPRPLPAALGAVIATNARRGRDGEMPR